MDSTVVLVLLGVAAVALTARNRQARPQDEPVPVRVEEDSQPVPRRR